MKSDICGISQPFPAKRTRERIRGVRLPSMLLWGQCSQTQFLEGGILANERVERRLTAILAADVAGYSRLMGADEEGTLALAGPSR